MDEYTIRFVKHQSNDPRLGRNVRHDSRSLRYLAPAASLASLESVRHASVFGSLDQGQIGSCTGNAATKAVSYSPLWSSATQTVLSTSDLVLDETYAVSVYSDATKLDGADGSYPPDDTGSDGLSVAKVMVNRGMISGYTHATSLNAVLTALQTQAVIVGTNFYSNMENPESDGRIRPTGRVLGGHEYVLDEIDVKNSRIWMQNSWSDSWGISGRAYFTFKDFEQLLAEDGDCTVFTPLSEPAPTPTPDPVDKTTPDEDLAAIARKWLTKSPFFYGYLQVALKKWLKDKKL